MLGKCRMKKNVVQETSIVDILGSVWNICSTSQRRDLRFLINFGFGELLTWHDAIYGGISLSGSW